MRACALPGCRRGDVGPKDGRPSVQYWKANRGTGKRRSSRPGCTKVVSWLVIWIEGTAFTAIHLSLPWIGSSGSPQLDVGCGAGLFLWLLSFVHRQFKVFG